MRVFVGKRSASVSSSDLSAEALAALVDRVVAMAREAPEDAYAGLAPAERLLHGELVHRPDEGVRLTLVSAGHPAPLRLSPGREAVPVVTPAGQVIGRVTMETIVKQAARHP